MRGAQRVGFVEDFVTDRAASWQAVGAQHHPRAEHLATRNHYGRAVAGELIFDSSLIEFGGDFTCFLEVETRKQQGIVFAAHAEHDAEHERGHERGGADRGEDPRRPRLQQQTNEIVHAHPLAANPLDRRWAEFAGWA